MAVDGDTLREIMLSAYDLELLNGEYAFINIIPFRDKKLFGDDSWYRVSWKFAYKVLLGTILERYTDCPVCWLIWNSTFFSFIKCTNTNEIIMYDSYDR